MLFSPFGNYTWVKQLKGVLQGSILGQLLFTVFLNSIFTLFQIQPFTTLLMIIQYLLFTNILTF